MDRYIDQASVAVIDYVALWKIDDKIETKTDTSVYKNYNRINAIIMVSNFLYLHIILEQ